MDPDIQRDFPALDDHNHKETSPSDFNYNCLAFALGDHSNWWEPPSLFGHYWPPGFSEDLTVDTAVSILQLHGFRRDLPFDASPDGDAVAIYAIADEWTHFAKYSNRIWMSKLGEGKDIEHLRP